MCIPSKSPYQGLFQGGNSFPMNQMAQIMNNPTLSMEHHDSPGLQDDGTTEYRDHVVQHNYHDHSKDDYSKYLEIPIACKGGVTVPFPMKLYDMLQHIDLNEPELASIVSWQPHGRCFVVKKIKEFTSEVLPRFFDQKKYASFQRQLNLYGFNRLTTGPDRGSYYHEMFLRSKKLLCRAIYRKKVKGTGTRMASNPEQEPNFYLMESMPRSDSDESSLQSEEVEEVTSPPSSLTPPPALEKMEEDTPVMPPLVLSNVSASDNIPNFDSSDSDGVKLDYLTQPNLTYASSSNAQEPSRSSDAKMLATALNDSNHDLKFVFDDMPFHSIDYEPIPISYNKSSHNNHHYRRNSYSNPPTSSSTSDDTSNSTLTPEALSEMERLGRLSMKMDLTDDELGELLFKIADDDLL